MDASDGIPSRSWLPIQVHCIFLPIAFHVKRRLWNLPQPPDFHLINGIPVRPQTPSPSQIRAPIGSMDSAMKGVSYRIPSRFIVTVNAMSIFLISFHLMATAIMMFSPSILPVCLRRFRSTCIAGGVSTSFIHPIPHSNGTEGIGLQVYMFTTSPFYQVIQSILKY